MCLRQPIVSAPLNDVSPLVEKFRKFTDPELGTVRTHYGKTNDSKDYQFLSHGLILTNKNDVSREIKQLIIQSLITNLIQK
jgi:hypothetical protein